MSQHPGPDTPQLPQRPAGDAYFPRIYQEEADKIQHLADTFWERTASVLQDKGETDGVQEYFIPRQEGEPLTQLPLMAGRCHVDGHTPLEIFTAIRITRFRMTWDPRIQSAMVVRSFSQHDFAFYLIWRGIGPIYSPRDAIGVQSVRAYNGAGELQAHPDFRTQRLVLGYKSVPSLPGIPEKAEGCARATILEGAYIIQATETGSEVTFFAKVDLATVIPSWISTHLVGETRRCVTRLRDALKTFGVPPILIDQQGCIALQFIEYYPETRSISLLATIVRPGTFGIYLDYEKMYTQGVVVSSLEGEVAPYVRIREEVANGADDGAPTNRPRVAIDVLDEGRGGDFRIVIDPKDKGGPETGTGPGWW